ncbi:hypothetical protein UCDDS831_g01129 [Diplodia seriata]|uniref:Uncharacterized protein n=1 Tax=Diplodia seriata TaxID=420778 RepID=A0A0G2HEH2_9PEZI|nr:hypothetical protein UCDDS831_g01129 [Diplodia seriata]
MSTSSTMNFAAGLEQFGTLGGLNWDEEFEELASPAPVIDSQDVVSRANLCHVQNMHLANIEQTAQVNADYAEDGPVIVRTHPFAPTDEVTPTEDPEDVYTTSPASPDSETVDLWEATLQNSVDISSDQDPTHEMPDTEQHDSTVIRSEGTHPGFTEESPSWYEFTATSPQVCQWVMSPGIFKDLKSTMNLCKDDHIVHRDVPRVASCLLRAIQHIYPVPNYLAYPHKAEGEKLPLPSFPRGSMGFKEPYDVDVPKDTYIPNGIKIRQPGPDGRAFYPRPSPLRNSISIENEENAGTHHPAQDSQSLESVPPSRAIQFLAASDEQPAESCHQVVGNLSPKDWLPSPSLVFVSGENFLEEEEATNSGMETKNTDITIIPASEDDEEITLQTYDLESVYYADEEIESSFEQKIEAQFEIEIDGGCLTSDMVDEDNEYFYSSSEKSYSWPSSPPLPFLDIDGSATESEPEIDDLPTTEATFGMPELTLPPYRKIPGLDYAHHLDAPLLICADHISSSLDQVAPGNTNEDALECSFDIHGSDDLATTLNSDEVDQAIARLERMSPVPIVELEAYNSEPSDPYSEPISHTEGSLSVILTKDVEKGDEILESRVEEALVTTSVKKHAQLVCSEIPDRPSEIAAGGVGGFIGVVGAIGHTIWSICSLNPLSVFLF